MRESMIQIRFVTPKLRLLRRDCFSESWPPTLDGEPFGGEMWAWPLPTVRRCMPAFKRGRTGKVEVVYVRRPAVGERNWDSHGR